VVLRLFFLLGFEDDGQLNLKSSETANMNIEIWLVQSKASDLRRNSIWGSKIFFLYFCWKLIFVKAMLNIHVRI